MIRRKPTQEELEELRWIANIQFRGCGRELIPDNIELVISPSTCKIRYLVLNNTIYLSIRASDYRYLLHIYSGQKLNQVLPHPLLRVYVNPKYSSFIRSGKNVFTKHVVVADPGIRPGDEVLIVDSESYELLGVGKAVKPGWAIPFHSWGEAVKTREGVGEYK